MKEALDHVSVMSREVMEWLDPQPGQTIIDGTLGLGGHSSLIAHAIGEKGCLISIDRDEASLKVARQRLEFFKGRLHLVHSNYSQLARVLESLEIAQVDGMLFDLGISSYQLDDQDRGFSFKAEGPLDMRMDQSQSTDAKELVNHLSEDKLADLIFHYGDERLSRRIARGIVQYRQQKKFETAKELEEVIYNVVPLSYRRQKIHPATRTFQALRIAVNQELESLEQLMGQFMGCLKVGGKIAVISFHSLEDRIVKDTFRELSRQNTLKIFTKKPLRPSEDEVKKNSRARSARLRVAERIA